MLHNNRNRRLRPLLALWAVCLAVSLFSCAMTTGSQPASIPADLVVGGASDCSDFMNGAAIGMGVGALFGCVWCVGGAVIAKGIALFC